MVQKTHSLLRGVQILFDLLSQIKVQSIHLLNIVHDLIDECRCLAALRLRNIGLLLLQVTRQVGDLAFTKLLIFCKHLMEVL